MPKHNFDDATFINIMKGQPIPNPNNDNQQAVVNLEPEPVEIIQPQVNPIAPPPVDPVEMDNPALPRANRISFLAIERRRDNFRRKSQLMLDYLNNARALLQGYQDRNRNNLESHRTKIVLRRNELIDRLILRITGTNPNQAATARFRDALRVPLNNTYQRSFIDNYFQQFHSQQLANTHQEVLEKIDRLSNDINRLRAEEVALPIADNTIQQIDLRENELNELGQTILGMQRRYFNYESTEIRAHSDQFKISLNNQEQFFHREIDRNMPYFVKCATKYLCHGTGKLPFQGPVRESSPLRTFFLNAVTPLSKHYFFGPSLTPVNNEVRNRIQEAGECLDLAAAKTLDKYNENPSCRVM